MEPAAAFAGLGRFFGVESIRTAPDRVEWTTRTSWWESPLEAAVEWSLRIAETPTKAHIAKLTPAARSVA